jgi:hypothetical protein
MQLTPSIATIYWTCPSDYLAILILVSTRSHQRKEFSGDRFRRNKSTSSSQVTHWAFRNSELGYVLSKTKCHLRWPKLRPRPSTHLRLQHRWHSSFREQRQSLPTFRDPLLLGSAQLYRQPHQLQETFSLQEILRLRQVQEQEAQLPQTPEMQKEIPNVEKRQTKRHPRTGYFANQL